MTKNKDYVVLLHGFWRSSKSMTKLADALIQAGFEVVNVDYPSKDETIESLSSGHLKSILNEKCTDSKRKINFVTHSMGGIIVRHFLANNKLKNLGRVVMLAPPNNGSKMADVFSKFEIVNLVLGPALKQLSTSKKSLTKTLPRPDYELGIIAGKLDGKVSAKSARLDGMKDFLMVPSAHSFIMDWDEVILATIKFLRKGKF